MCFWLTILAPCLTIPVFGLRFLARVSPPCFWLRSGPCLPPMFLAPFRPLSHLYVLGPVRARFSPPCSLPSIGLCFSTPPPRLLARIQASVCRPVSEASRNERFTCVLRAEIRDSPPPSNCPVDSERLHLAANVESEEITVRDFRRLNPESSVIRTLLVLLISTSEELYRHTGEHHPTRDPRSRSAIIPEIRSR